MRYFWLTLLICLPSTGCSAFIAGVGTDLNSFVTKEQVHAKFGEPVTSGIEDGKPFEEFYTRRKVCDPVAAEYCGLAFLGTLGLSEFAAVPWQIYRSSSGAIIGQRLRVIYDPGDIVADVTVDGSGRHDPFRSWPQRFPLAADPVSANDPSKDQSSAPHVKLD